MQARSEQLQAPIKDGAICTGKLSAAQCRLRVIRSRLMELDKQAESPGGLTADLEAESGLLRALASPEEDILKGGQCAECASPALSQCEQYVRGYGPCSHRTALGSTR